MIPVDRSRVIRRPPRFAVLRRGDPYRLKPSFCQCFLVVPFAILNTTADFGAVLAAEYLIAALGILLAVLLAEPMDAAHRTLNKWLIKQRSLQHRSEAMRDLATDRDLLPGPMWTGRRTRITSAAWPSRGSLRPSSLCPRSAPRPSARRGYGCGHDLSTLRCCQDLWARPIRKIALARARTEFECPLEQRACRSALVFIRSGIRHEKPCDCDSGPHAQRIDQARPGGFADLRPKRRPFSGAGEPCLPAAPHPPPRSAP